MTTFVLDSSAIVAWVLREVGRWRAIDALLSAPTADPVLPAPGLAEVIETVRRKGNSSSPTLIASALAARGVRTELLTEADLVRAAVLMETAKSNPGAVHPVTSRPVTLSLADSLILAIVERLDVQIVTLDRYWAEFAAAGHTTAQVRCI